MIKNIIIAIFLLIIGLSIFNNYGPKEQIVTSSQQQSEVTLESKEGKTIEESSLTIMDAIKLSTLISVLAQLYLVGIYFKAKKQRNHACFTILLISAAFTLVSVALGSISYFIEIPQEQSTNLYRYSLFLGIPAIFTWILGMRSLVNAYVDVAPETPSVPPPSSSIGKWGPK